MTTPHKINREHYSTKNEGPGETQLHSRLRSFRLAIEAQNLSRMTVQSYVSTLGRFVRYVLAEGMPTDPTALTREHIETFLLWLQRTTCPQTGQPYKPGTVQVYYLRLHVFFAWLVEMDEIPRSPMEKIKAPKVPQTKPPSLTDAQLRALLKQCEGKSFIARRDTALLRLLIDTGMRAGELANIRLDQIDWEHRGVEVLGKGRKPRICWFGSKTARALDIYVNWARNKHKDADLPYLWLGQQGRLTRSGVYRMVVDRGRAAGVPQCHPHMFRHHAAYEHLRVRGSEIGLMRRMGWSSHDMVYRYTKGVADDLTREEYNKLGLGEQL